MDIAKEPWKTDMLHDWAYEIVAHSQRVHKVARFLGIPESDELHDIEEWIGGEEHEVGKFSKHVFRGLSPLQHNNRGPGTDEPASLEPGIVCQDWRPVLYQGRNGSPPSHRPWAVLVWRLTPAGSAPTPPRTR